MLKRSIVIGLLVTMLCLCGCSSMFTTEYFSVSDYTEEEHNELRRDAEEISSYNELKLALNKMVLAHSDSERFLFMDYGETLLADLALACEEVSDETALASYSVDYILNDLQRYITYYDATITINYKRTQAEIDAIVDVDGQAQLPEVLSEAMTEHESELAVKIDDSDLTEEMIFFAAHRAFGQDPLSCVLEPKISTRVHPVSGYSRIVEIEFEYAEDSSTIDGMREELEWVINNMLTGLNVQPTTEFALHIYNLLASHCIYDPTGELRAENHSLDTDYHSTLYGALYENLADSRGIALAYSALCERAGIEAIVVDGNLDQKEHSWNIIKLNGIYYHVDVSVDEELGLPVAFLKNDAQMLGNYWWNIEDYPECTGEFDMAEYLETVG